MINFLEGTVAEINPDSVVINCGGVGYEAAVTPGTASALTLNENSRLYVTESIGEDHYDLFGFLSVHEKRWFRLLISVSGVGPKAGMSILSYNTPDVLTAAIINGDEKVFSACPGIGKKIAQRIILELKDKIAKSVSASDKAMISSGAPVSTGGKGSAYDEALSALSVLGYNTSDIVPILRKINTEGMNTQSIIREVLKFMV